MCEWMLGINLIVQLAVNMAETYNILSSYSNKETSNFKTTEGEITLNGSIIVNVTMRVCNKESKPNQVELAFVYN